MAKSGNSWSVLRWGHQWRGTSWEGDIKHASSWANEESGHARREGASEALRQAMLSEDCASLRRALLDAEHVEGISAILVDNAQRRLARMGQAESDSQGLQLSDASLNADAPSLVQFPAMPTHVENRVSDFDNGPFANPAVLHNEAFYLPSLLGEPSDRSTFQALMKELDFHTCWLNTGMRFSRDICIGSDDILQNSPVYDAIVKRLSDYFGVTVVRSLVNLYRDGNDWCNLHSDQYHQGGYPIDLTIGATFGETRRLIWVEKENDMHKIEIPQRNGDVFAFSDIINSGWRHMIPRESPECGPRISVIIWCARSKAGTDTLGKVPLGDFPHMLYHNPKGRGRDFLVRSLSGRNDRRHKRDVNGHTSTGRHPKSVSPARNKTELLSPARTTSPMSETPELETQESLLAADEATKALTLQGSQQVFAILRGKKLIENRSWKIPIGWYAIHASANFINEERAERTKKAWPEVPAESDLPHGAIVGLFFIKEHREPHECNDTYAWARGPVCHIISKTVELPEPIHCRGGKGTWVIPVEIRRRLRSQLLSYPAVVRQFDVSIVM